MQKFALKLAGLGLVLTVLFFSSCGEDPIVVDPLGPDIQFVSDTDVFSSDFTAEVGTAFTVRVSLSTGDAKLNTLTINESVNGSTAAKLPTGRFTVDGGAVTSNNPLLIVGTDKDGVTFDITITPSALEADGDVTLYSFTVADESALTDLVDIQVTSEVSTTPISETLTGVLLNQAGPVGTGGLNLDDGTGTGSTTMGSELRDLGIDCTATGENWRAQFGTINGADMRAVDLTKLSETFSFATTTTTEAIFEAYDTGIELANGVSTAPNCNETTVTDVTGEVAVGDMFSVFANGIYYLVEVAEINFVAGSNADNFVLNIKY
jgi:hypothetical protein